MAAPDLHFEIVDEVPAPPGNSAPRGWWPVQLDVHRRRRRGRMTLRRLVLFAAVAAWVGCTVLVLLPANHP